MRDRGGNEKNGSRNMTIIPPSMGVSPCHILKAYGKVRGLNDLEVHKK